MNNRYKDVLPNDLLDSAKALKQLGLQEIAWEHNDALRVMECLGDKGYLILGGDVYRLTENSLESTYDSWYINRDNSRSWSEVVRESVEKGISYIAKYRELNGENFLYSIVFIGK